MPVSTVRFECCDSPAALAARATEFILDSAEAAIAARGHFRIVLAGGGTPLACYRLLAERTAEWARWEVFFGDERCVPVHDAARNSHAAAHAWLDRVAIPLPQRHPIPAELGAEEGARRYAALVAPYLPFDLVLLGMGEDGHTASLFPGRALDDSAAAIAVHNAPKPPPDRVSLSAHALANGRERLVLIAGADKRAALASWRTGADLPISRVSATTPTRVLFDTAASG